MCEPIREAKIVAERGAVDRSAGIFQQPIIGESIHIVILWETIQHRFGPLLTRERRCQAEHDAVAAAAERVNLTRSGDFNVITPEQVAAVVRAIEDRQAGAVVAVAGRAGGSSTTSQTWTRPPVDAAASSSCPVGATSQVRSLHQLSNS